MNIDFPPGQIRFCNDSVPLQSGSCNEPMSINQRLVGVGNPKTNIHPIVAAPSHDLNFWKTSDLTIHSHINKKSHFDTSRSGYGCDPPLECNSRESIEYYTPTEMARRDWDSHHSWYYPEQQPFSSITTPPLTFIGEPIQSNLGISQVLEFDNQKVKDDEKLWIDPTRENIYDPRFTGYGTFYRYYWNDEKHGPDYFYKDIDSVSMPLIHRSKIDVFPWATTSNGEQTRLLANTDFIESSSLFRNEMQDRLMRKRNAEWWQRRVAPITTMVK